MAPPKTKAKGSKAEEQQQPTSEVPQSRQSTRTSTSNKSRTSYHVDNPATYFNEQMIEEYLDDIWYNMDPRENSAPPKKSSTKPRRSAGRSIYFEPSIQDQKYVEKYQDNMWHNYHTKKLEKKAKNKEIEEDPPPAESKKAKPPKSKARRS